MNIDKKGLADYLANAYGAERLVAVAALCGLLYGVAVGKSVRELVQNVKRGPSDRSGILPPDFKFARIVTHRPVKREPEHIDLLRDAAGRFAEGS